MGKDRHQSQYSVMCHAFKQLRQGCFGSRELMIVSQSQPVHGFSLVHNLRVKYQCKLVKVQDLTANAAPFLMHTSAVDLIIVH